MIELLLLTSCISIQFRGDACSAAWNAYAAYNPNVEIAKKRLERLYVKPLPDELKTVAGVAAPIYRKEIKFKVYSNIYLDIKDAGWGLVGYEYRF